MALKAEARRVASASKLIHIGQQSITKPSQVIKMISLMASPAFSVGAMGERHLLSVAASLC
jgi:hypothetical protein